MVNRALVKRPNERNSKMFRKMRKQQVDESKRRDIQRIAFLMSAVLLGAALVASVGCKTADSHKGGFTVPGFLGLDKPEE